MGFEELVVLSTCNRTEFYGCAEALEPARGALLDWLREHSQDPAIASHLYAYTDTEAAVPFCLKGAGDGVSAVLEHRCPALWLEARRCRRVASQ